MTKWRRFFFVFFFSQEKTFMQTARK